MKLGYIQSGNKAVAEVAQMQGGQIVVSSLDPSYQPPIMTYQNMTLLQHAVYAGQTLKWDITWLPVVGGLLTEGEADDLPTASDLIDKMP